MQTVTSETLTNRHIREYSGQGVSITLLTPHSRGGAAARGHFGQSCLWVLSLAAPLRPTSGPAISDAGAAPPRARAYTSNIMMIMIVFAVQTDGATPAMPLDFDAHLPVAVCGHAA